MFQWEVQVRRDEDQVNEPGLTAVRAEFEQVRRANHSAMTAIYAIYGVVVFVAVLFPYGRFSTTLPESGLPEAILAVVLAVFSLVAPRLLAEATRIIDQERIYELYGRYFSPEAMAVMRAEIAVSVDAYRLVIALISAVALLALAIRDFAS